MFSPLVSKVNPFHLAVVCYLAFQRAFGAFLAIAFRFAGLKEAALDAPPFLPPMRPKATA